MMELNELIFELSKRIIRQETTVLDLGDSGVIDSIIDYFKGIDRNIKYVVVSDSIRNRLKNKDYNNLSVSEIDVNNTSFFGSINYSLILSVFALTNVPFECKQEVIQNVYDNLSYGSYFIFVEKCLGNSFDFNKIFTELSSPCDKEEYIFTSKMYQSLLRDAGFKQIDTFWRYLNSVAWIAKKV